VAKPVITLN